MKKLFLCSAIGIPGVAASVRNHLGHANVLKTAFITTPIEVEDMSDDSWYQDDRHSLTSAGFDIFDYTLTGKNETDLYHDLVGIDALYISGGNEFWLKHQANKCNFGNFVKKLVESDKIYVGTSAGSIVMAPDMTPALQITDLENCPEKITDFSGFGIVDFLPMPHWGSTDFQERYLESDRMDRLYQKNSRTILLNNYQYVEVVDDVYRIVDVRREK